MGTGRSRLHRLALLALAAAVLSACGARTAPPPQPGHSRGIPPDLRGRRVLLLPFQRVSDVGGDPNAELAFALGGIGGDVDWVREADVQEMLDRTPAMQVRTRGLAVDAFLMAEVDRVGDPLFGHLRRLTALMDTEAVVLPIQASFEPNLEVPGSPPRVRLSLALIEPRTGRVLWFAIDEGGDFEREDPRGLASAVDTVARRLLWYVGR